MASLPSADPVWEDHLTAAYEFETPTENGHAYPRTHWMVRARRLWVEFGQKDVDNRNDIARLITRANAQEVAINLAKLDFGPGIQAYGNPTVEEQACIDAIDAYQGMISIYEEWRHASLHCTDYPGESVSWLQAEIADCRAALDNNIYPRYRDVRRLAGPLHRAGGPGPQARVPGYLERLQDVVVQGVFKKRKRLAQTWKPHNLEGDQWVGGWSLGSGGQGFVNLWIRLDDHRTIVDRRAVKDTYIRPSDWDRLSFWHGDVRNIETRRPVDVAAMSFLGTDAQCDKIVHLQSWAPHWQNMMYRTYMAFHAFNDLESLIKGYLNPDPGDDLYVPEAFVWRVFEACVEAGLAMEKGAPGYDGVDWLPIVHRDLKPGNILLDEKASSDWASYPTPKIGDFGFALFTSEDDAFNPDAYVGPGTRGYRAPEQTELLDPDSFELVTPGERFLLTSKTNVWATGKTVMELMNLSRGKDAAEYCQPKYTLTDREPEFSDEALWYSKKLRRLVQACVRYEPHRRPTFEQLQQRIRRYTAYPGSSNDADDDDPDPMDWGDNPDPDDDNDDPDPMDWGDGADSDDDNDPDDLAGGMRAFTPAGGVANPQRLQQLQSKLGRPFPIGRTIVAGGGGDDDLPAPGMGW